MAPSSLRSIFIGSSNEAKRLTQELVELLSNSGTVQVLPWFEAFDLGFGALEDLARPLEEVDFAALVLARDDKVTRREDKLDVPRDNVIFELGLFMGKLTRQRAFASSKKV